MNIIIIIIPLKTNFRNNSLLIVDNILVNNDLQTNRNIFKKKKKTRENNNNNRNRNIEEFLSRIRISKYLQKLEKNLEEKRKWWEI